MDPVNAHQKLFTSRQLIALNTFTELVGSALSQTCADSLSSQHPPIPCKHDERPSYPNYDTAVATYLALGVSKAADYWSSLCIWRSDPKNLGIGHVFARHAIQMVWDFAEANPFSQSSGNWSNNIDWIARALEDVPCGVRGTVQQLDALADCDYGDRPVVSTDPPYYDNVSYADLSDFFYTWLRKGLGAIYPQLFSTLLVPKTQELIAEPFRHGGRDAAKSYFESQMSSVFDRLEKSATSDYPISVYYAFKQAENTEVAEENAQPVSTGWETMLQALVNVPFQIVGTWPMRTELGNRIRSLGSNALASSIVLMCRKRTVSAPLATRKQFITALRQELPESLRNLQHGNIAPVDLAQAAIGPGMAIFTRYSCVMETDGAPMSVRTALGLINQVLDEVLAEQEGEFDADTRWALAWFEQHGMDEGPFGVAEILSKAKNTAVDKMVEAGVVLSRGGKVRLVKRDELPEDWKPARDGRLSVWEATQHLIRALDQEGESGAAALLRQLGGLAETCRDLAYRLYTLCERKKWADEALAYNGLVVAWPELSKLALAKSGETMRQGELHE